MMTKETDMNTVKLDGWTFIIGDGIQFTTDGKRSPNYPGFIIKNFKINGEETIINYSNGSYDYLDTIVSMLKSGDALLIPAVAFKAKKKKVSTTCECEKLKLQIATLQKKNDELTYALTRLAEQAMNAAGWRMKLELKEK
jgi:hypothetical protein